MPLLTDALTDDRSRPFWPEILQILARIGPAAEPATTALARRIEHPDPLIHGLASYAAASIRQSTNFAVTALHTLLLDTNYSRARATLPLRVGEQTQGLGHREAAAWLLGEIGPPAAEALPGLRSLQREPNLWLRLFAARAIWRISGETEVFLVAAERELKGDNDAAVVWICQLLAEMGPPARASEAALKSAMTRNLTVRAAAFQALQKIAGG
jgi:HEAT repeat protein